MGCHDFGRVKAGNSTALVNGNTATESAEICKRQGYNIPRKAACSIGLYALAATWHNIKHKIRGVSPPCPYPACSSCPKHAEFLDTGPFSTWSQPWTPETPIYHAGTKIYILSTVTDTQGSRGSMLISFVHSTQDYRRQIP